MRRKLTAADREKMKKLWHAELNLTTIGLRFRVSSKLVRKILTSQGIDVPKVTRML